MVNTKESSAEMEISLNVFIAKKLKNTKITWIIEAVCTIILSLPMIKIWEIVFDYLRMNF